MPVLCWQEWFLMFGSFLFNAFGLSTSSWLINQFQTVWVVAFVILFQPELRRLLIYVGQTRFLVKYLRLEHQIQFYRLLNHA